MKIAKKLSVLLIALLAMLAPQSAMATEVTEVHARLINGTWVWDQAEVDKLQGDIYYFDVSAMSVTAGYSGRNVIARRGCPDNSAACWVGDGGLGDMQFSGTGTIKGNWPGRGRFYSGNRYGSVTYKLNGEVRASPIFPPNTQADPSINSRNIGVYGQSVTRW